MKKNRYLLTALLLALSFTACKKESGTKDPATPSVTLPTVTAEPRRPTEPPVEPGKFTEPESRYFFMENSTETTQTYIAIYPVDSVHSVFQFDIVSLKPGVDIPETETYALNFVKQENNEYFSEDTDASGNSVTASYIEGNGLMVSGNASFSLLTGIYRETDDCCEIADLTVYNFLSAVSETGVRNSLRNIADKFECYTAGDWFICCNLFTEDSLCSSFLVAKDFSVVINMTSSRNEVVYGSLTNTLNAVRTYEIYNEDENPVTMEEPLVFPMVQSGSSMTVGSMDEVVLSAPYDLTESLKIVSDNTDVVTVNGNTITALAPGNATLTVTADYCGAVKDFTLDISVAEADVSTDFDEYDEFEDSIYTDSKYSTYFDKISMRATMNVCFEDGLISVDILWADDMYTEHHWSYVGPDEEADGVYSLNGRYTIDTYTDDGFFNEEIIAENIAAALTKDSDGCFRWYDCFEETDHDCIFELYPY